MVKLRRYSSISAFTLIPGFTTVQAVYGYGYDKSYIISGLYGCLSLVIAGVVATIYGILSAVDEDLTQNIYMGAALSLTLLLVIVFCADMLSVLWTMLFMVTCGSGECNFWSMIKSETTAPHFLLYPVLVLFSPLLMLLVKFRHNGASWTEG